MGDMGDVFNAHRKACQEKRASNREQSTQILESKGIAFEMRNNGAHLIVADHYDFWPGTGLWKDRQDGKRGRGVHSLLIRIRRET